MHILVGICFTIFQIIFYWLCCYRCPNFPPFVPNHPLLPQVILTPLFMSMGHGQVHWLLHFLCCTLPLHGYSVMTYLYCLIPSPPHPFPYTALASGIHEKRNTYLSTIESKKQTKQTRTETESWLWRVFCFTVWKNTLLNQVWNADSFLKISSYNSTIYWEAGKQTKFASSSFKNYSLHTCTY